MKKTFILFYLFLVALSLTYLNMNIVIDAKEDLSNIETYVEKNLLNDISFTNDLETITDDKKISNNWIGVSKAKVVKEQSKAYSGDSCVDLVFFQEGLEAKLFNGIYQDVEVEANTNYVISIYAKKYGPIASEQFFIGYRNPLSNNVWTPVQEYVCLNFTNQYKQYNFVINTGNLTTIRIEMYTTSIVYDGESSKTGYLIDDVNLYKMASIDKASFSIDESNTLIGSKMDVSIIAELSNGKKDIQLYNNEFLKNNFFDYYSIFFESSNEKIASSDLNGNLVACGNGETKIKMTINLFGYIYIGKDELIEVKSNSTNKYISNVSISIKDEIVFTDYTKISLAAMLSDGIILDLNECKIDVQVADPNVCTIFYMNNDYYVIGVGKGTTAIYATVTYNDLTNFGKLNITLDTKNYLKDSGFETNDKVHAWIFDSSCGCGIDTGVLNALSHSGYANIWLMAPTYWDKNIKNDSIFKIYQNVTLTKGIYDLSAYINRFFATGPEGTIYNVGGTVYLGVTLLDSNGNLTEKDYYTSFDTTYGNSTYQRLSSLLELEDGTYQVYVKVVGDIDFGMGMQIDDVTLVEAIYPESIECYILEDDIVVDDMNKLYVKAKYEDGSVENIASGIRIISSDYNILYESSGFLIARNPGEATITARITILGREYQDKIKLVIDSETIVKPDSPKNPINLWIMIPTIIGSIMVIGGVTILIIKKRKAVK